MQMSGSAIIQTTLIIVLALLALLFSRYAAFVQTSLLAGFTFLCCTAVTIVVVPGCIRRLRGTGS
jgi:predicted RND superfamily exporter protein